MALVPAGCSRPAIGLLLAVASSRRSTGRLKYSMSTNTWQHNFAALAKFARLSRRRARMLNQISTWLSLEVCV